MAKHDRPLRPVDPRTRALRALYSAIALRDRPQASRLLAESPWLAREAAALGATREDANSYIIEGIARYIYAGDTALHMAAAAYATDIAADLVSGGADVHAKNRRGAEPLHYAADGIPGAPHWDPEAQSAVIGFLIQAGADPNCKDKGGVGPLHRAVRTRCAGAVRALLNNGADVRLKNKSGSTPLHLAVQNTGRGGSGSPAARDQQAEIIRLLVRHGARASDQDSAGKSVKDCVKADWIQTLLGDR